MFCKDITDSDAFLDMPLSSQALYFHLGMHADDDGFLGSSKRVIRCIGCNEDDFKILVAKRFVIVFETGVCVIKHWRMNNQIRKDRHTATVYTRELQSLSLRENGSYTDRTMDAGHLGNQMATDGKPSIVEYSKVENSIDTTPKPKKSKPKKKPMYSEDFEKFWEVYPLKKGKSKAFEKFPDVVDEVGLDVLIEKAKEYSKECELLDRESAYIKHGSTWINQRGREDEYETEPKKKDKPQEHQAFYRPKRKQNGTILKSENLPRKSGESVGNDR